MTAELNKAPQAVVGAELPPPIIATRHGTPAYTVGQMLDYARTAIATDRAQQAGAAAPSVREFLQQLSQCSGGMVNGNRLASRAKELLAATPQPQGAGMQVASDLLNADELAALRRFDECAQDGEGYDVPKAMMRRLSEIGVVQRLSGAYYHVTEFGMSVLASPAQASAAPADQASLGVGSIDEILKGIDEQEVQSEHGWWETSVGAAFGAQKLAEVKAWAARCAALASAAPGQARVAVPNLNAGSLQAAYDALRFYVDASDAELAERGISRADALRVAREAESAMLAASPEPATAAVPAECPMCDGHGCTHYPDGEWRGKCAVCKGTGIDQSAAPSAQPVEQPADDARDPLYEKAAMIVRTKSRASIALVQRHLMIGYNRASRLMEAMEKEGVVSAPDDNGHRTVCAAMQASKGATDGAVGGAA